MIYVKFDCSNNTVLKAVEFLSSILYPDDSDKDNEASDESKVVEKSKPKVVTSDSNDLVVTGKSLVPPTPLYAACALIDLALQEGSTDNISAIVVKFT